MKEGITYLLLMSREILRVLEAQLAEPIYRYECETYLTRIDDFLTFQII